MSRRQGIVPPSDADAEPAASTADAAYAERLERLSRRGGSLRRVLDPQRPYRWNLRRLRPGRMLDVGCGVGRNLLHLQGSGVGSGVGVDHNATCVATCRELGLTAYTTDEFPTSADAQPASYDSLLISHVLEHMTADEAEALVRSYLPYVKRGGRVIVICPQERGQASDRTHVTFVDEGALRKLAARLGLRVVMVRSFPFTRAVGRFFTYNETVAVLAA